MTQIKNQEPIRKERRKLAITLSLDALREVLKLPESVTINGVHYMEDRDLIYLVLSSDTFPVVLEGCELRIYPCYKRKSGNFKVELPNGTR